MTWARPATAVFALCVLLGTASSGVRGQGLIQNAKCTDLSLLTLDAPEVSIAVQLFQAMNVLRLSGLPVGASVFLPSNAALASLPSEVDLPFTVDYLVQAIPALGPDLASRVNSLLMYCISPIGALGPAALVAKRELPTALNGSVLLMSQPVAGQYTVTDARGVTARLIRTAPLPAAFTTCLTAVYVVDKLLLPAVTLGGVPASPESAYNTDPPFQPVPAGPTFASRSTYYGPDRAHGIHGGNDNVFEHVSASQYSPYDLFRIGRRFCAMTEQFMRLGYMGKVVRVTGTKATFDFVVVDLLPDRNDGKNVQMDVHNMEDWLALGGDARDGMLNITFFMVGRATVPVSPYSPWDPKKFGFT